MQLKTKGYTLVPLKMYFKHGKVKVEIGVATGKKLYDTADFPLFVDRKRALFSSWYEFFPRSQGANFDPATKKWTSGTFDGSHQRLEEVAAMGFDVVYLPPIHPIGRAFRKGRNNTLAVENDPGSPWRSAARRGGHDAAT